MGNILQGLTPEKVFAYFEAICEIPHGSYHVDAISDYLVAFAKERNLFVLQDEWKNVLIKKPASKGMEDAPTVILQGHMDMVCEKNSDVEHDFLTEGLKLQVSGDDITARGTTLGGDDGIAVAYALAILDDDTLPHPPLEVLLTTEEEVGMEGAFGFDVSLLDGTVLLNLDSEEEGTVLTSCAGGVTVTVRYPLQYEKPKGNCYEIFIHGLKGGHSGADIHFGRANANVLMGQMLYVFSQTGISYQLAFLEGGMKSNAIPRECRAFVYLDENQLEGIKIVLQDFVTRVAQEFGEREDSIQVDFSPAGRRFEKVYSGYVRDAFADSVSHVTDGVCHMSEEVTGLVETSSNLGVVREQEDALELVFLLRSCKEEELSKAEDVISYVILQGAANYIEKYEKSVVEHCKPQIESSNRYPGWAYKQNSALRQLVTDVYRKQYGKEMEVTAIHAGLECGIFASQKDFDIVSIGPDILNIHTPEETLKISSARRTYELVCEVLRRAGELKK